MQYCLVIQSYLTAGKVLLTWRLRSLLFWFFVRQRFRLSSVLHFFWAPKLWSCTSDSLELFGCTTVYLFCWSSCFFVGERFVKPVLTLYHSFAVARKYKAESSINGRNWTASSVDRIFWSAILWTEHEHIFVLFMSVIISVILSALLSTVQCYVFGVSVLFCFLFTSTPGDDEFFHSTKY